MTELLVLNDGKQQMQAVSLDGTRVRTLITGLKERPDGIVVDQSRGHVYWTNMGAPDPGGGPRSEVAYTRNGSLERADLDGTNRVTIVPRGAFTTGKQLAADFEAGVLYWCDREGMQVLCCNLDGSELRPLVVSAVGDEPAHVARKPPCGHRCRFGSARAVLDAEGRTRCRRRQGLPYPARSAGRRKSTPAQRHRTAVEGPARAHRSPLAGRGDAGVDRSRRQTEGQHARPRDRGAIGRYTGDHVYRMPRGDRTGRRLRVGVLVGDLGGSIRHVNLDSGLDTEVVHLGPGRTGIAIAEL